MSIRRVFPGVAMAATFTGGCYHGPNASIEGGTSHGDVTMGIASTDDTTGAVSDPGAESETGDAPIAPVCPDELPTSALDFLGSPNLGGVGDGIGMGPAPELGLPVFTLEAWIRWDGYGTQAGSGAGGVVAEPIVSKGRGESDGSVLDCNYFFGVDADGRLGADFEDMASGANHPITGTGVIEIGRWTHVAATFDGTAWSLYIDGTLDATLMVEDGAVPRFDSIQHFGIGAAYDSTGAPGGGFDGLIDDVRVWSRALQADELQAGMYGELPDTTDLVAHWPLNEGAGSVISDEISGVDGERTGATWVDHGRPSRASAPPEPFLAGPLEVTTADAAVVAVTLSDDDGDDLHVQFWGRERADAEPFSVVVLPDTQYYVAEVKPASRGGTPQMFFDQTQWIHDNAEYHGIRAVLHVGDLVHNNHAYISEWNLADQVMATLEQPLPGSPDGIPYGIAVGNHDQADNTSPGEAQIYNQFFGVDRFAGRSYFGGHHGTTNNHSYIAFTAGNLKFLAFFFDFDQPDSPEGNPGPPPETLAWARRIAKQHPDHYALLSMHHLLQNSENNGSVDTPFAGQGRIRYEALRGEPNLRLAFGGHVRVEGRRTDEAASTVHSILSNYQFDGDGGSGKLRLLTFYPEVNEMEVQTYSPHYDQWYTEPDANYTLSIDLDYGGGAFTLVGEFNHVHAGETVSVEWPNVTAGRTYDWYATVTDCVHTITSERASFSVQ